MNYLLPLTTNQKTENMKLEKGKQYECIKDVVMTSGRAEYIKGRVYTCENEGCLTDETVDEFHSWTERSAKLYFKPYEPNEQPKTGDKVLVCNGQNKDAYTESDLVSFGNFLLADRGDGNYLMSKKYVTHADLENWKNEKK